ncbi:hypothetical protein K439DRAFT_199214 [Ramaria rubella]|nr:hypothetical protein K439DRAFT_199214 [Ramaria rubella]
MNTPLLLTSVALLAGVAARPIENDHRGDDLRELVHSPTSDNRQAFLGRIPSDKLNGSGSPRFSNINDLADPDPGLSSPYIGPQHHLSGIEQELGLPALTPDIPIPSSLTQRPHKTEQPHVAPEAPDYSPLVVILVFSSLAALVLLGLTVAVVYVTQIMRQTVLRENVWRNIVGGRAGDPEKKESGDLSWSEKETERITQRNETKLLEDGSNAEQQVGGVAARTVPDAGSSSLALDAIKPLDDPVEDPDVMPLSENATEPSAPMVCERNSNRDKSMRLALVGWTYDNWVTHFMFALFGWLGVFLGGPRDQ